MNFGNLGIAMGAGVDEYHKQLDTNRKEAAEERAVTEWQQKQQQYERQMKQQQAMDAVNAKYGQYRELARKGDYSFADGLMKEYNANQGAWADGLTVQGQSTPNGQMLHFVGQDGKPVRSVPLNQQTLGQMLDDAHMTELKYASPEMFQNSYYKDRDYGLKTEEVGLKRQEATDRGEYQRGILSWHNKQAERPQFMQDGAGKVLAISPDGKLLGTYGSARPVIGHGGAGEPAPLNAQEQDLLRGIMDRYAATQDPTERARIGQEYQMAQSRILLGRGKVPNLPGGMINNPKAMPDIPKEAVTEFSKAFFSADPKTQQAMKLNNKALYELVTGDSGQLKVGARAGVGAGAPEQAAPTGPYATRRGMGFVVVDPRTNRMEPVAEYERRTGNAWADLEVR